MMGRSIKSDGGILINIIVCAMDYATTGGENSPMSKPFLSIFKFN